MTESSSRIRLLPAGLWHPRFGYTSMMLRDGPISRSLHGIIEYGAGLLFILAPFLLSFDHGAAVATSIIVGVIVLFVAAATDGPTSLSNAIPLSIHVVLDYALAIVLIASPFLFGYSGETAPTAFFIGLGIVHLLVSVGTQFRPTEPHA